MTNSGSVPDKSIVFREFVGYVIDLHLTLAISYSAMEAVNPGGGWGNMKCTTAVRVHLYEYVDSSRYIVQELIRPFVVTPFIFVHYKLIEN